MPMPFRAASVLPQRGHDHLEIYAVVTKADGTVIDHGCVARTEHPPRKPTLISRLGGLFR